MSSRSNIRSTSAATDAPTRRRIANVRRRMQQAPEPAPTPALRARELDSDGLSARQRLARDGVVVVRVLTAAEADASTAHMLEATNFARVCLAPKTVSPAPARPRRRDAVPGRCRLAHITDYLGPETGATPLTPAQAMRRWREVSAGTPLISRKEGFYTGAWAAWTPHSGWLVRACAGAYASAVLSPEELAANPEMHWVPNRFRDHPPTLATGAPALTVPGTGARATAVGGGPKGLHIDAPHAELFPTVAPAAAAAAPKPASYGGYLNLGGATYFGCVPVGANRRAGFLAAYAACLVRLGRAGEHTRAGITYFDEHLLNTEPTLRAALDLAPGEAAVSYVRVGHGQMILWDSRIVHALKGAPGTTRRAFKFYVGYSFGEPSGPWTHTADAVRTMARTGKKPTHYPSGERWKEVPSGGNWRSHCYRVGFPASQSQVLRMQQSVWFSHRNFPAVVRPDDEIPAQSTLSLLRWRYQPQDFDDAVSTLSTHALDVEPQTVAPAVVGHRWSTGDRAYTTAWHTRAPARAALKDARAVAAAHLKAQKAAAAAAAASAAAASATTAAAAASDDSDSDSDSLPLLSTRARKRRRRQLVLEETPTAAVFASDTSDASEQEDDDEDMAWC